MDQKILDKFTRIDELLIQNTQVAQQNLAATGDLIALLQRQSGPAPSQFPEVFSDIPEIRRIDLATANVDLEISYPPADYIQVYCDGILDGISIKLHNQSSPLINLSEFDFVPIRSNKLYLTNDVRVGRSYLTLLMGRNVPFGRNYSGGGGGGITLAEMAARLGSVNTFDRRGEIVWYDDFEDNINKWEIGGNGAGNGVALSTDRARNGAKSAKLTTGSDGSRTSLIRRYYPFPKLGKVGEEISIAVTTQLEDFYLTAQVYNGTHQLHASIKYLASDDSLYYKDAANDFVPFATGIVLFSGNLVFNTMKLVIDLNTFTYERVIFNEQEWDLSGKAFYTPEIVQTPHAIMYVHTTGLAGWNVDTYVDDAIITQNEP